MSGTTSISELPNQQPQDNVVLSIQEKNQVQQQFIPNNNQAPQNQVVFTPQAPQQIPQQQPPPQLVPQNPANLQSRDIPQNTQQFNEQDQIRPNYIPEQGEDYINNEDTLFNMMQRNRQEENKKDRMDQVYDELQLPILVMVLFFGFQMPFFKKLITKQFPNLLQVDGNYSLAGYVVTSLLFGASFYGIKRGVDYLTDI
mgnify:CR=1 FL=1|tara:strand:+ start:645 stop:1241 length:597 start_codon:yes stop_codon:yes gene_type:complete